MFWRRDDEVCDGKAVEQKRGETSNKYIRFEVIDLNGRSVSKLVPERHRHRAVFAPEIILSFTANGQVFGTVPEDAERGFPNGRLVPRWDTWLELPWASDSSQKVISRVYCEFERVSPRSLSPVTPRTICARLLQELKEKHGYELLVGGELEFSIAKPTNQSGKTDWEPSFDWGQIFSTLGAANHEDFFCELESSLHKVGIDILTMNQEYGAGQLEISFVPRFGLEALDNTMTFRMATKEIAKKRGQMASFMSFPFPGSCGNGAHFNFSLWAEGEEADSTTKEFSKEGEGSDVVEEQTRGKCNVLKDASQTAGMSSVAQHFLAGILAHAPALEAICSPTSSCYLRHGRFAPAVANWGLEDRLAAIRVKSSPSQPASNCYIEFRLPSAAANPYLVAAALVAAGLDGLEKKLVLPPPQQTKDTGAKALPGSLKESLAALAADEVLSEKLGQEFLRWFSSLKQKEEEMIEGFLSKSVSGRDRTEADYCAAWRSSFMEEL